MSYSHILGEEATAELLRASLSTVLYIDTYIVTGLFEKNMICIFISLFTQPDYQLGTVSRDYEKVLGPKNLS